jgi:S-DNA-T family DNA segregation ATPase FtsK/SpoIIIE
VEPLVLVLIDELAAVTAYAPDREVKQRAGAALSLLLSQGRAVGYQVVACLQDPRKDVIPMRGLFTQTLGLRLRDWAETDMILGPAARQAGAACEQIPASLPGVGWMVTDTGGPPVRFRLAQVTDADIAAAATRFPTPYRLPLPDNPPADAASQEAGAPRQPRKPRTPRASTETTRNETATGVSGSDAA